MRLSVIMTEINLKSKTREIIGRKVKKYRKKGLIPAVVYGHKITPQNIWVNDLDLKKTFSRSGENTIIRLEIDDKNAVDVLIHNTQTDPMTGDFCHVDFFQVRMDEKIEADIPFEFIGESPAVKELGGVLVKNFSEIKVSCLPADLPHAIEINFKELKTFDDHIKIKDLKISDKVKILDDGEAIIVSVIPPRTEEELSKLNEKVEADVTKVEEIVKGTPVEEKTEQS